MIKWKTIGKVLIAVLNGKTITISDPVQAEKITEQIKGYNENPDPATLQTIEDEANFEKNAEKRKITDQISEKEKEAQSIEKTIEKTGQTKKKQTAIEQLLKDGINPDFFILSEKGKIQLKDQPYDIPRPLALEFAERQIDGKSFAHLISFWKLLLLSPNDQARQDAFKYLTKQGMTITKQGYFLTYRRVHLMKNVNPEQLKTEIYTVPVSFLEEAAGKVKRWKGSEKGYFIVQTEDQNNPFKLVRRDKLKPGVVNLGSLSSFTNPEENQISSGEGKISKTRKVFTDNRTKKFEIELGVPVQMARDKTDENNKVECSSGLHVGTPTYIKDNPWLGEVILACLINPMHIVSVPYNDAHKMRVCEYLPIKEVTLSEVDEFELSDLSEFEYAYMAYEAKDIEKQLKTMKGQINIIDEGLFDSFTKYQSIQDLEKLQSKIEELKQNVAELRLSNDPVSNKLDLKHIEAIISSRLIAQ